MNLISIIAGLLLLVILVFWLWAAFDMLMSKKLKKREKGLWFLLFLVLSLPTAIVWTIVRK